MTGSGIGALCTVQNLPRRWILSFFLILTCVIICTYMYLHKPIQTGKSVTLSLVRPGAEPRRVHPCQEKTIVKPCNCERETRKPANVSTSCEGPIIQDVKCLDQYDFQERLIMEKKLVPPAALRQQDTTRGRQKTKRFVVIDKRFEDPVSVKKGTFAGLRCLVSQCEYSGDTSTASLETADAVIFRHIFDKPVFKRPKDQVWVMFLLESAHNTADFTQFKNLINYTATYRTSSTIYNPYGLYRPYTARNPKPNINLSAINYASGKTKRVAMMVSNCGNVQNDRAKYVDELKKYIHVDIFGGCGPNKCPRAKMAECVTKITRYCKFYLSFENSNCREYITEKAFRNAWTHNMLPIVMGAHPDDYKKVAPPHSYIHVDEFDSPKALAEYLDKLDKNDKLYNEYFKWKEVGYVDPTESMDFYCRFCALMWAERNRRTWVSDLNAWWRRKGMCVGPGKWANRTKLHLEDDQRVYQHYAPYP